MRILYSHRVQSRDGQGVHIEELVAAFRQAGHEVLVVGPGFYDQAAFGGESRMVAMLRRRLRGPAAELAELAYNLLAYRRLHRSWKAFRPDLIYERCNLYFLAGTWLTRRTGTPLYLEVNAPLAEERRLHGGLALAALAAQLEHSTWRAAARLLPVTAVLAERLALAGVDPARITVMPNGADPARFHARAEPPGDAPVVLGFVGFVRAWHGLDRVIAGMAEPGGQAVARGAGGPGASPWDCRARAFHRRDGAGRCAEPGRRVRHRAAADGNRLRLTAENLRLHGRRLRHRRAGPAQHT
jgi:glycosyltransferase involved in cell wall biosynthesis